VIAVSGLLLLAGTVGCAGRDADASRTVSSFQQSVSADDEITDGEAREGVRRLLRCLADAGLTGKVWTDPDIDPGNYATDLGFPRAAGGSAPDPDEEGRRVEAAFKRCEERYHPILSSYRQRHHAGRQARQRTAALDCLRTDAPVMLDAAAASEWPAANDHLVEEAERQHGEKVASATYECLYYYGTPWHSLPG
jgi:hypothetical protein